MRSDDVMRAGRCSSSGILPLENCKQDMCVYWNKKKNQKEIKLYLVSPADLETVSGPVIINRIDLTCISLPNRRVLNICLHAAQRLKDRKARC